eukprot:scaffold1525_cov142-Cylindrotheca_fusiformis.AAC.137
MSRSVKKEDFLDLNELHPYGVLPGGNRFFCSSSGYRPEEVFPDNLWQQVLSFCDDRALGNVVQSSRYLYVAGHQPELWRDLVLRRCSEEKQTISSACSSWKDTYLKLFVRDASPMVHSPIPVPDVYSDEYYRTHLCRSFAIPKTWLVQNNSSAHEPSQVSFSKTTKPPRQSCQQEVARVSVEDLSPSQFFEEYEMKNMPVIVEGAAKGKALDRWCSASYLNEHSSGRKTYRATSGAAPLPANFLFDAYQDYGNFSYLEESPLYLFDRTAFTSNDQWSDDFFPEFYRKCPFWDPSERHGHDLLQHLGANRRPDHTWLIMGPKRSGSVFHLDPNATHAWNACIQGRKRWIFYPPGVNPPGVFPSEDGDEVALPLSVGEWLMQYWTEHMDQYRKRPLHERPMECTVGPGDVIFVPHGWWHMVINLDDKNIAITHNYVSPSNLGNVLKFFKEKQDQVSGCRDRKESIKPEHLYSELVKALERKEPDHLKNALMQSGWTCRTWKEATKSFMSKPDTKEKSVPSRQSKKRPLENEEPNSCRKSFIEMTDKVEAFSFSFL